MDMGRWDNDEDGLEREIIELNELECDSLEKEIEMIEEEEDMCSCQVVDNMCCPIHGVLRDDFY